MRAQRAWTSSAKHWPGRTMALVTSVGVAISLITLVVTVTRPNNASAGPARPSSSSVPPAPSPSGSPAAPLLEPLLVALTPSESESGTEAVLQQSVDPQASEQELMTRAAWEDGSFAHWAATRNPVGVNSMKTLLAVTNRSSSQVTVMNIRSVADCHVPVGKTLFYVETPEGTGSGSGVGGLPTIEKSLPLLFAYSPRGASAAASVSDADFFRSHSVHLSPHQQQIFSVTFESDEIDCSIALDVDLTVDGIGVTQRLTSVQSPFLLSGGAKVSEPLPFAQFEKVFVLKLGAEHFVEVNPLTYHLG